MSKEQLQNSELEQVSGGTKARPEWVWCRNCNRTSDLTSYYPDGCLVRRAHGCELYSDYKCPHCGYTWRT